MGLPFCVRDWTERALMIPCPVTMASPNRSVAGSAPRSSIRALARFARSDVLLAALVVGIVAMMVLPLPTLLLDLLLTLNISLAVVLLLVATQIGRPLRFSTLPSVLLFATLFRLGLNVSSTRLILLQADAGRVIDAFGRFVAGNNLVVGAVIFVILTIIQYLFIARGSERVAEVAARFALDAMPGRQMAIDAYLRAGVIDAAEARRMRDDLGRESQLFGAMDGAMKFVKGDAVAGMLITVINIAGGLAIGVAQRGMELDRALSIYTVLTVGDGLVSQIPALLVATAAGVVVSRVAGRRGEQLGPQIGDQLLAYPRALVLAAALLALLALLPGLPALPFAVLSVGMFALAHTVARRGRRRDRLSHDRGSPLDEKPGQPPPLEIVVGVDLALCADPNSPHGRRCEELLFGLRRLVWDELGLPLDQPPVRVDPTLPPADYRLMVHRAPAARGTVPDRTALVLAEPDQLRRLGVATDNPYPADGLRPGLWQVPPDRARVLADAGIEPVDPPTLLSLHLGQVVRARAADLLDLQTTRDLLDRLERTHPALVEQLSDDNAVTLPTVNRVLRRLLSDGVSIRDLARIVEAVTLAPRSADLCALTVAARRVLGRTIFAPHLDADGRLPVLRLDPLLEELCRDGLRRADPEGPSFAPGVADDLLAAVNAALSRHPDPVVLLTAADLRLPVQRLARRLPGAITVVSADELPDQLTLDVRGTVAPRSERTP